MLVGLFNSRYPGNEPICLPLSLEQRNKAGSNRVAEIGLPCGPGVTPYNAYTGRLHPKGVPFSGLSYIEG